MKKEIFIAVLLGLSFGLIITYGIYRARQADTQDQIATLEASPEVTPAELLDTNLVIDSPNDESITDSQTSTIAGTTFANAFIVIYVNEEPYITTADQAGAFSVSATLEDGSNVIGVHSINQDGVESVKEVIVTYLSQPLIEETDDSGGVESEDDE